MKPMGLRERVRLAIDSPVDDVQRTLNDAPELDAATRLSLQLNGWFAGIAGALEEIAIEIDHLRERKDQE